MNKTSQRRAIDNYRHRLSERGMARFEVIGRDSDRELIRSLARRLAETNDDSDRLRLAVQQTLGASVAQKGGIVAALRRSALVGADLDVKRARESGRRIQI